MTSARGKAAVEDQRPAGDVGGNSSRDPFPPQGRVANRVLGAALKRGLCFYPATGMAGERGGDAIMIAPPFVIGDSEVDFIARTVHAALDEVKPSL